MSAAAVQNAYASQAGAAAGAVDLPAVNPGLVIKDVPPSHRSKVKSLQERYAEEREKRLRSEGASQYVTLAKSDRFKYLVDDCWARQDSVSKLPLHDGMHTRFFIVGAGFGGILNAVHLIQAGFKPEDIIIADIAGGFGGTWYWNRYPGLMCDVESYIYLPLLEETNYVPKHKYSYGSEIREHANRIAQQWHFENRGAFQQRIEKLDWDDDRQCWQVQTTDLSTNKSIRLTAEFVFVAAGLLQNPKLTEFNGIDDFKGRFFHTARWDYDCTGGSPDDPSLVKLKGKTVGIVGTGATAVQAVPHLAKWADELYIFQRTPSAVDTRGQRETDPSEFAKNVGNGKGWQWERARNFNCFLNNIEPRPALNMVNDGWTHMPSMSALLGGQKKVDPSNVADHVASMHALDAPRQESIRDRVEHVVVNSDTAEKLKPWYAGWCKRPCFHDDYLKTFNEPHVHLIDTDGKGINKLTQTGIIANDQHYDLDCIIFSTGFNFDARLSPTRKAGITTHGRKGKNLDNKWSEQYATLHGVVTRDFPNLFFPGLSQAAGSPNLTSALNMLTYHSAYMVSQAFKSTPSDRLTIEPSLEAEEEWAMKIASGAAVFASAAGCTPGYFNSEGEADRMSQEQQIKSARIATWSRGMNDFMEVIERWRQDGRMEGLEVVAV